MTGLLWYAWTGFVVAAVMREPGERWRWRGALLAGLLWPAALYFVLFSDTGCSHCRRDA